jgi:hypothetical protein
MTPTRRATILLVAAAATTVAVAPAHAAPTRRNWSPPPPRPTRLTPAYPTRLTPADPTRLTPADPTRLTPADRPADPPASPTSADAARDRSSDGGTQPAAVTPSTAGSVVFIRADNVWIARPDGSAARRLTSNGTAATPYRYPSEDDAGTVVALRGNAITRLDQAGHVLASFAVPTPGLGVDFASVSPDGSTVAYSWLGAYTDCSFTPCHTFFEHSLAYTSAARSHPISGGPGDVQWASWVTNRRVVVGGPNEDVRYTDLGATNSSEWYTDCNYSGSTCASDPSAEFWNLFPAVSRQGDRYASVIVNLDNNGGGPRQTFLNVLNTANFGTADPPAAPTARCVVNGIATPGDWPASTDATVQTPSWSPDGRSLVTAFENAAHQWQVWRVDVGTDVTDCDSYAGGPILTDATQPRWGKAALRMPTTTTLSVSSAAPVYQHTLTLSARVNTTAATGSVRFREGSKVLATVAVQAGRATFRTTRLGAGPHSLNAVYLGSGALYGSTSRATVVTVQPTTPPRGWKFHRVTSTRLIATRLAARRAVDVRAARRSPVPSTAKGVLLRLVLSHGTATTRVYVCPRPRTGSGITPRSCWPHAIRARHTGSWYGISRIGRRYDVRLWNRTGRISARLYVYGYYT